MGKLPGSIAELPNLGPASAAMLENIGVVSVEAFMQSDAFDLYRRLQEQRGSISLNMLYAMLGAQSGCPWQVLARERKMEILLRLDDMGIAPKR